MLPKKLLFYFFCALSFIAPAYASEITIETAIKIALSQSPTVLKMREAESIRALEYDNAAVKRYPSLDFDTSNGIRRHLHKLNTYQSPYVSDASLTLSQPLYDHGVTSSAQRLAELNLELAKVQTQQAQNELILKVATAYYQLNSVELSFKTRQRQNKLLESQLRLLENQVKQGTKEKSDYLRFRARVQQAFINLSEAGRNRHEAEVNLKQILGLDLVQEYPSFFMLTQEQVEDTPLTPPKVPPNLNHSLLQRRIDLQAAIDRESVASAQRKTYPEISIATGLYYKTSNYMFSSIAPYEKDTITWDILLKFKYNLWDNGTKQRDVLIAKHRQQSNQGGFTEQNLSSSAKIKILMSDIDSLNKIYNLNKDLVLLEQENYQKLDKEYRQRKQTYLDIINAFNTLLSAKLALYSTYMSLSERLAEYHFHQGTIYNFLVTDS